MNQTRRSFLKAAGAIGALTQSVPAVATPLQGAMSRKDVLKANADAVLKRSVAAGDVPGVVGAVINQDEPLYVGAKGVRTLGGSVPMSMDTVMFIASMTKPITTVAAMQLVEQGKLSLDGPAAKVLPELGTVQVLDGYDNSGAPILRAPKAPITLRQLLTHTSGFVYDIWDASLARYYSSQKIPGLATATRAALRVPIAFDPGTRWEYGIGIDWTGLLIEAASGIRLGEYFKRNITGPLGMASTAFERTDSMVARSAGVHSRAEDGNLSAIPFGPVAHPDVESGGAGLYSTPEDYLKLMRLFLNEGRGNGHQILKKESVNQMLINNMGELRVGKLNTAIPFLSRDAEFFPSLPKTWGLGFMVNIDSAPTGRSEGSLSWAGLCNTFFWIDPKRRLGGLLMMQVLPFVDPAALDVFYDFETSVYAALS